jgi:hypothetical protein
MGNRPILGPSMRAPHKSAMPPTMWTTPEPTKSMTEVRNAPDEKKAILGMRSWWARRRVQQRKKGD